MMFDAALHLRDTRNDWRPREPLHQPPVFVWPPQPLGFIKWVFGYPGYFLPWNVLYLAIAFVSWIILTPDLSRMRHLSAGWIVPLFVGNLGLVCLVVGTWHWRLYMRKAQGLAFKYSGRWLAGSSSKFLFRSQVLDNVFWTVASAVPIWTAYEVVTLWAQANGLLPYIGWRTHPIYCVLLLCFIPLFREVHFYLVHRLIHWPPLYRSIHSLHHKNVNPGPWSGLAMHPVEHLLYFSSVLLHWFVPSHPLHVIFHMQLSALTPSQGHCGFEKILLGKNTAVETGNYMHYLHHKYFIVNYGGDGLVPIDQLFGTFHDGTVAADELLKRRYRVRPRAPDLF
jgi:sterol desaturase/sphingolipid hydroxylase (fatty acid hydroxylase superfamily)